MSERQLALSTQEGGALAPETRQPTIMDIIARASTDPNMDVDKLERLIALSERAQEKEAEKAFSVAMNKAQADIRPIAADANNPQTRSKYASYLALDKALRPVYSRHGFSLSFDTDTAAREGDIRVLCHVAHDAGYSRTYKLDMPADGKGAKGGDVMTRTHATGAAMTYGQRYLLKLIFNIAVGEDDDNGADTAVPIDTDQMQHILDQIAATDSNIEDFCAFMGVEAVKHITQAQYGKAIQALNAKARKAKKQ